MTVWNNFPNPADFITNFIPRVFVLCDHYPYCPIQLLIYTLCNCSWLSRRCPSKMCGTSGRWWTPKTIFGGSQLEQLSSGVVWGLVDAWRHQCWLLSTLPNCNLSSPMYTMSGNDVWSMWYISSQRPPIPWQRCICWWLFQTNPPNNCSRWWWIHILCLRLLPHNS